MILTFGASLRPSCDCRAKRTDAFLRQLATNLLRPRRLSTIRRRNPDRPRAREARKLIDAEHTRYVATQKGGFGVSVEPEIVEPLKRLGGSYHGIVGPEHDLASAVAAHALHQL